MARITMTSGFMVIPEGEYVFRIYDVDYDETFGILKISMVNAKGMTHVERYSLKDGNDQPNEGALNAFSYFAKTAMDDFSLEDIDPDDLIGHYIRAEVIHNTRPNKNDPTKTVTFSNLGDKSVAYEFDETPTQRALTMGRKPAAKPQPKADDEFDLDALLNG